MRQHVQTAAYHVVGTGLTVSQSITLRTLIHEMCIMKNAAECVSGVLAQNIHHVIQPGCCKVNARSACDANRTVGYFLLSERAGDVHPATSSGLDRQANYFVL